jgi:outer membrane PBP1 activator LpoA protein
VRVLAVIFAALVLVGCKEDNTRFDAAVFRDAAARDDEDQLTRQAYAAERQQALVGLSRARVHALLGRKPDEVWREVHSEAWDVGLVNDAMGPGDQGYLAVEYDRSWRRVVRVEVAY